MSSLKNEIKRFIRKASLRIKISFMINNAIVGLKASLYLVLILLIISLFLVFPGAYKIISILIITGIVASILITFIRAPKDKEIALLVDSKGLNERLTTSLELMNNDDEVSKAQREDTVNQIKNYNIKENIPIRINRKEVCKLTIILLLSILIVFIPTDAKKESSKIREFNKTQNEMVDEVKKEEKEIKENDKLTEGEKKDLEKLLEEIQEDIKNAETSEDLKKALEKFDKKIEKLEEKLESKEAKDKLRELRESLFKDVKNKNSQEALKDLNTLNKELEKTKEAEELKKAIESENNDEIKKALDKLNDSLKDMSDLEKSQLANALKQASKNVLSTELSEALKNASEGILDGDLDVSDLSEALATMKKQASGNNKGSQKADGSNQGNGSSNGEGNGNGSGNGSGNGGQGTGNGNGSGNGPGWNTGSKNGSEVERDKNTGEEVFIPGRTNGNDDNLSGAANENGASQGVETESGLNMNGEKVDYGKVIGDYSKEVLDGLESSSLPEGLKSLIKDYFDGLN